MKQIKTIKHLSNHTVKTYYKKYNGVKRIIVKSSRFE